MSEALRRQFDAWTPTQRQGVAGGLSVEGLAKLLAVLDLPRQRLLVEAADRKGLEKLLALPGAAGLPAELAGLARKRLDEPAEAAPAVLVTREGRMGTMEDRAVLGLPLKARGDLTDATRLGVESQGLRSPNGVQGSLRLVSGIEEPAELDDPVAELKADRYALRRGGRA